MFQWFLNRVQLDAVLSGGMILMNEKFAVFEDLGIQKGNNSAHYVKCSVKAAM